jgi:hypothetical protein
LPQDNKNVTKERHKWTKAERQYIKGIVHNYSLQRWTDQDIVDYLRSEKKIKTGRSTVTKIKNSVVEEAELRDSGAKYIAVYKERLDSLLSYQKKLHELCNSESSPELVLRAISELHKIEMSLHTLMKELPGDIKTSEDFDEKDKAKEKNGFLTFDEWVSESNNLRPRIGDDSCYSDEENGQYYWGLHKKYKEYLKDWDTQNFGPDLDEAWGTESNPPKAIIRGP